MAYGIGEVAKLVGVTPQTLKNWERQGHIPQAKRRFITRWRVWDEEEVKVIEALVKDRTAQN